MSAPCSSRPRPRTAGAGRSWLAVLATALLLAGCGGGGGGGTSPAAPVAPTPTPPPPPPAVQVDESRAASATATAQAGGTVQATGADGTVYTLTVPPGALSRDTTITIAPLLSADGVAIDRLVAGVRAEPSGLRFATPATLALQLPAGSALPPYGLRGFISANDGSELEFIPQRTDGSALTVAVPHFSVVGVAQFDDWLWACRPERVHHVAHQNACARLRPLFDVERARVAAEGGELDVVFILDVMGELQTWAQDGLAQRMTAARQQPLSEAFEHAVDEWTSWLHLWDVAGEQLTDRMNEFEGRLLGALIDQIQDQYRLLLVARMEALNAECLRDRGRVGYYVFQVLILDVYWTAYQGLPRPLPWQQEYCVDIHIEAFVPPVLTPGQDANVPIDIRVRFSDGVELPGQRLSVVVTATNASVTPGGGFFTSPIAQNFSLEPRARSSRLTITAAFANDFVQVRRPDGTFEVASVDTGVPRTARFGAGDDAGELELLAGPSSSLTLELTDAAPHEVNGAPLRGFARSTQFPQQDTVALDVPTATYETFAGDRFTAAASGTLTRSVQQDPGGTVTVTIAGQVTQSLEMIQTVSSSRRNIAAIVESRWGSVTATPVQATAHWDVGSTEWSGGLGPPYFSDGDGTVHQPSAVGVPLQLEPGRWCVTQQGRKRQVAGAPTTVTPFQSTVTLRP